MFSGCAAGMEEHEKQRGAWSKPGPAGASGQGAVTEGAVTEGAVRRAALGGGRLPLADLEVGSVSPGPLELGPAVPWGCLCGSQSRAGACGRAAVAA